MRCAIRCSFLNRQKKNGLRKHVCFPQTTHRYIDLAFNPKTFCCSQKLNSQARLIEKLKYIARIGNISVDAIRIGIYCVQIVKFGCQATWENCLRKGKTKSNAEHYYKSSKQIIMEHERNHINSMALACEIACIRMRNSSTK